MRKTFLFLIIVTLFIPFAQSSAQIYHERHTGIGVKGGLNISSFYGSGVEELAGDVGPATGYIAGLFVSVPVKRRFTIQPELYYTVKGAERDGELVDTVNNMRLSGNIRTRLAYMEIPVLVKVNLSTESAPVPNLYFGPVISFLQSAKIIFKDDQELEIPIDENVTDIDAGIVVGGGVDIPFGTGHLVTDVRLTAGLRSIDASPRDLSAHNYTFSFMLGFEFPLIRSF